MTQIILHSTNSIHYLGKHHLILVFPLLIVNHFKETIPYLVLPVNLNFDLLHLIQSPFYYPILVIRDLLRSFALDGLFVE